MDAHNGVWILEDRARARTLYRRESTKRRVGVVGPIGRSRRARQRTAHSERCGPLESIIFQKASPPPHVY